MVGSAKLHPPYMLPDFYDSGYLRSKNGCQILIYQSRIKYKVYQTVIFVKSESNHIREKFSGKPLTVDFTLKAPPAPSPSIAFAPL